LAENGDKQKTEGSKKKLISSDSFEGLRQWQTFILALIIIVSYIVYFGWIISISTSGTPNYSGMTTLTGTFGIIAAAVVGYYFGQRNLKQAADMAQQAQGEVEVKKVELENEAKDHVDNMKDGISVYTDIEKFLADAEKQRNKPISEIEGFDNLKSTVTTRIDNVNSMLKKKENKIKSIEATKL
jgi:hypothetical protein